MTRGVLKAYPDQCGVHIQGIAGPPVADLGGGASAARAPPCPDLNHFVGFFKSFKTSPSLSKSVQPFKSYRLLKFSTQKPPEITILALIF